ncbi:MAG: sugar phosphate nucleotidyltransferase [Erythrobacter sp.]|jgi:mannose-1-phosphate guanylyltransferase/mannose-1-phosphate guanylyltransferase/mannose-6-phosphate isomerase|nr:sugar phosphate nucleotidyltransferase [Erythrobacter sp.]
MSAPEPIHPVILCGGSGTRLWPVSRKARPKPFLPLVGETTLFEEAVRRVSAPGFGAPIVVAGAQHCGLIEAQIAPLANEYRVIVEPCARNTAPAIALAAALLPEDAIMLVCPSDHHIADADAFHEAARAAARLASADHLVAFGIAPDRAETGYGYLRRGEALEGGYRIEKFVEKPDRPTAEHYLASGEYSWNGGIFAFRAGAFLAELARHRPVMAEAIAAAVARGEAEGARFHPEAAAFEAIEGDSIDYAVMENTRAAAMVSVDMGWSDIGNWPALADALTARQGADAAGNLARGPAEFIDTRGVFAMSDGPRISAVGIEDVCIIVCDGEILVTSREGAQKVSWLTGARRQ